MDIKFNVGADVQEARNAVNQLSIDVDKSVSGVKTINVSADVSKAKSQVNQLVTQVNQIESKKISLELDAKTTLTQIDSVNKKLTDLEKKKTSLSIETREANAKIEAFKKQINDIMSKEAKLEIDPKEAQKQISFIQKELSKIENQKIKIAVESEVAEKSISTINSELKELNDKKLKIDAEVSANTKELESIKQEIDGLEGKSVDVAVNVNTEGFADIKAKFDMLGNLGGSINEFSESGKAFSETMRQVQAQTGLTADEMDNLKSSAFNAFEAGVGESMNDAIKAIATGRQVLKSFLAPEEIDKFVVSAEGIAKVFGGEVNEVINKSRTFISAFGLDGEKAANLISYAMQNSTGDMGDSLDTLDEYSQLMKTAGYSATEFTGTLVFGVQNGTRNMDKLADAIKETQIRLNAGDITNSLKEINSPITQTIQGIVDLGASGQKSVKDVLSESANAIQTAFDEGKISAGVRDKLATALSGTMAEDIGGQLYTKIFSAKLDTAQIEEKARQAGASMASAIAPQTIFETMTRGLEGVWTQISASIAPLTASVGGLLSSVASVAPALSLVNELDFAKIGGQFTGLVDNVKNFATTIISQLIPSYGAQAVAAETATTAQTGLNMAFLTNPIFAWIAGITAVIASIYLLYKNVESVRVFIDGLGETLKDIFGGIVIAISPVWDAIKSIGGVIFDYITMPFQIVIGIISNVLSAFSGLGSAGASIGTTIAGLKPIFSAVFGTIATIFDKISLVINFVSNLIINILTPAIIPIINGIITLASVVGGALYEAFNKIWELVQPIIDGISSIGGAVSDLLDKAFGNSKDKAKESAEGIKEEFEKSLNSDANLKVKASIDLENSANDLDKAKQKVAELQNNLQNAMSSGKSPKDIEKIKGELQNANDEVNSLSNDLAKAVPNSISKATTSTEVLADGTTKIKTNYDINIDAVKQFASEQRKANSGENAKAQSAFTAGIVQQAQEYNNAKNRLIELQKKAATGNITDKEKKELKDSENTVNKLGKTLVDNLKKGEAKGYDMTKSVQTVAGAFGTTTDKVDGMIKKQDDAKKSVEALALSVDNLGATWDAINSGLGTVNKNSVGAINLIKLAIEAQRKGLKADDFIKSYSGADQAQQKMLKDNWNNLGGLLKNAEKGASDSAKTQLKLNEQSAKINKKFTADGIKATQDAAKEQRKQDELSAVNRLRINKLATADLIQNEQQKAIDILKINFDLDKQTAQIEAKYAEDRAIGQRELTRKNKELEEKYKADLAKAQIEADKKRFEELMKNNEENAKREQESMQVNADSLKDLIDKGFVNEKQLYDYRVLTLDLFDKKQQGLYDSLITNNSDYIKKQQELMSAIVGGAITPESAVKELVSYRQAVANELIKTNQYAKTINEQGIKQRAELEKKLTIDENNALSLIKINGIKNVNEQTYQYQLYLAKKTYAEDLAQAGGINSKKLEAFNKYSQAIITAQNDLAQSQFSTFQSLSANILNVFSQSFNSIQAISNVSVIDQAKKDLSDIKAQELDLMKQRNEGSIKNEEYSKKFIELEEKKKKAQQDASLSQINWLKTLGSATSSAFQKTSDTFTGLNNTMYGQFTKNIEDQKIALETYGKDSEEYQKTTDDASKMVSQSWANAGTAVVSTFLAVKAAGQSWIKAMVMAFLAGIRAMIPMIIFQIFAKEIAEKSFAGLVTAPILVGVLSALMAGLESGLGQMNFAKGGQAPAVFGEGLHINKKSVIVANVAETGRPEFVMNPASTAVGLNELQEINQRKISPSQWASEKFNTGGIIKRLEAIETAIKTTKLIETKQSFSVKAVNNIIGSVTSLDLARC